MVGCAGGERPYTRPGKVNYHMKEQDVLLITYMSSRYHLFVFVPVVDLVPILGPLGLLPELCDEIANWAAKITARRVREVMWKVYCASEITYSLITMPWDERAAYKTMAGQIVVNSKTLLARNADPVEIVDTIYGLESRWGIKCKKSTEDDWMVNWLRYREEGLVFHDDCPGEVRLKCGLVAGYYDE